MNRLYVFTFLVLILLVPTPAFALPVINNIVFKPSSNIWIGESVILQVNCTDDENYSITDVYAQITGENGYTLPNQDLALQDGLYIKVIESLYLTKPNSFLTNIFCINNNTNQSNQTSIFSVSNFTVDIIKITPSEIYIGDQIEADISVKKNNEPISSGMNFNLTLDNQPKLPKISPPYDPIRGWIIYLDAPSNSGTHTLQITASYDRVNGTVTTSFDVNDPIQFSISSIDKTWVKSNDTVNLQIKAIDRGNVIPINTNNLAVYIDSTQATVISITPVSNYFTLTVSMPSLSTGDHTLVASLSYKGYTYTDSKAIDYIVPISGRIADEDDKGVSVQFNFISDGVEKLRLYTNSNGDYSGTIPLGTYDIQAIFPQSTLYLDDVSISSFEDPIKYFYSTSANIPGLNLVGLYAYEMALPYSRASIDMKYDERNALNERLIKVYKCEVWNAGRNSCDSTWFEINAYIDTIRNTVSVNSTSLSAYALGTLKQLSIDFNLNKENFYLKDLVKVRGMVIDENKDPVSNATVYVYIKNTNINAKVISDSNGLFSIEFLSPEKEGSYSLILSAERNPYLNFNSSISLETVKNKELSIVFPDTVKINRGENFTQDFSLVNIGQADLSSLNISLSGIPDSYYTLISKIEKVGVGEEKKLSVYFSIPSNVSPGTFSVSLRAFNDEFSKEKVFGFTILEKNQTTTAPVPTTGFLGRITLPQLDINYIYILLFAIVSFSSAFILKNKKVKRQDREEIKDLISDVKNYMTRKEIEPVSDKKFLSNPQRAILEKDLGDK